MTRLSAAERAYYQTVGTALQAWRAWQMNGMPGPEPVIDPEWLGIDWLAVALAALAFGP